MKKLLLFCVVVLFLAGCGPINPAITIEESCALARVENGVEISCPGQDPIVVYDGEAGAPGEEGAEGEQGPEGGQGVRGEQGESPIIEIIDPCGKESSYDEVLFRLSDDLIYAVYSDKEKVHLVELIPGTYTTTDSTNCKFTVTEDNDVIW